MHNLESCPFCQNTPSYNPESSVYECLAFMGCVAFSSSVDKCAQGDRFSAKKVWDKSVVTAPRN